jgi:NADPH-dependent curcumin reductase CurA
VCKPVAGDTVLVSGAAGATGSVVGQLAKIAGCKAIGIAGGQEKCDWLVKEAGYDHAIDYKSEDVRAMIKEYAPGGVDVIFDNVGGSILNDMLSQIAMNARVVICGGISRYETGTLPAGPENYFNIVFMRASMAGFIVIDWMNEFPAIRKRLAAMVNQGKISYQEDIQHGFENAPQTLQRLFSGSNRGKQLLKL